MADSLPNLNFGFEDLRSRMAQFTARFDAFIEKGRKQVLQERNQFHSNLAELQSMLFFPPFCHSCLFLSRATLDMLTARAHFT